VGSSPDLADAAHVHLSVAHPLEAWELSRRHPTAQGHSRTSGIHTVTNIRIQVFIVFCIWEESYLGQRDRTS
jgi:hypothetical protein